MSAFLSAFLSAENSLLFIACYSASYLASLLARCLLFRFLYHPPTVDNSVACELADAIAYEFPNPFFAVRWGGAADRGEVLCGRFPARHKNKSLLGGFGGQAQAPHPEPLGGHTAQPQEGITLPVIPKEWIGGRPAHSGSPFDGNHHSFSQARRLSISVMTTLACSGDRQIVSSLSGQLVCRIHKKPPSDM